MATQPIDRQKAKHNFQTASRNQPKLVNRTNKTIRGEIAPRHEAPRFWGYYRAVWRSMT